MKKTLKISEVLEYYDVPQLFTAQDTDGFNYLCLCVDVDDNGDLNYISAQLSQYQLDSFMNCDMELTYILRFAEQKGNLYIVTLIDEENVTAKPFNGRLTSKILPEKPYYYNQNVEMELA